MFERIKDLFSKIRIPDLKFKRNSPRKKIASEEAGKIYKTWLFILPVLCGLALGRLAAIALGFGLGAFAGSSGLSDTAVTGFNDRAAEIEKQRGLDGFLAANPFRISPMKAPDESAKKEELPPEPEPETDSKLENLILRGTLPGVGAWVENNGNLILLLVGKDIENYKLTTVKYSEVVFRRGKNSVTKYLTYGSLPEAPKVAEAPKPAPKAAEPAPQADGNVVAATPGGQEGQIASETVNQLVQNPFDELKRIRIRPSETAGGLEVQWIQNDSILKRLGVQKGDVIRSVNGIPFTNMGDIANSINSLMNSERFDVEVTRGGKTEALRYVVK